MLDFLFHGFRGKLVAGAQYDQILDAADDAPRARVQFALIARMEPSIPQHFGTLLWTIPISRKHIGTTNHNFIILTELHLDPGNRRPYSSRHRMARIIHGADPGGFREPIDLQHRNAQHGEIPLSFRRERSRSAD